MNLLPDASCELVVDTFYDWGLPTMQPDHGWATQEIRYLKLALLAHGLTIDNSAWAPLRARGKLPQQVRSGASNGLDIVLPGEVWVNAPVYTDPSSGEAPSLKYIDDSFVLVYDKKEIPVQVVPRPAYYERLTSDGTPMRLIGQMCADRIGFGLTNNCFFWGRKYRCRFCSIGSNKKDEAPEKTLDAILETLNAAVHDPIMPPRHVLLSGGTPAEDDWGIARFAYYCRKIKEHFNLRIYLMTVPPKTDDDLHELHDAGVDEIAMNMEVYDEAVAAKVIPGKHALIGRDRYLQSLRKAVDLWGRSNVRSLLVAGCEPMASTLEGVRHILDAGATPILSVFRPVPGSEMERAKPPETDWLNNLWTAAETLCALHAASLGPACPACRNNVLA